MTFNQGAQIYVSGLGQWFRVVDQTEKTVRLVDSDGVPNWYDKNRIAFWMTQDEPSLCSDGDW